MKFGARLWWAAGVCVALLAGFVLGIWTGAETEQDVMVELITRANLDDNCKAQLSDAMQEIIDDYEGTPAPPAAVSVSPPTQASGPCATRSTFDALR